MLIAITILALLTAYTSQSIIKASKDKVRLQKEIDRGSKLQNAVRFIERDVNLAFHYRDFNEEIEKAIKEKSKSGGSTGTGTTTAGDFGGTTGGTSGTGGTGTTTGTPPVPLDFEPKKFEKLTQFIGASDSMHFTSLSHIRMMQDSQESEQGEVGYYLENCRPRGADKSVSCLWRRSSAYIDIDVAKGGASVVLLENVKTFKLRYFGEDKLDWVSAWKSDLGGDAATIDKFPLAVELTITSEDQGKESTISAVFPLHFPNNKPKEEETSNSANSGSATGTTTGTPSP